LVEDQAKQMIESSSNYKSIIRETITPLKVELTQYKQENNNLKAQNAEIVKQYTREQRLMVSAWIEHQNYK
jgi:hypothetical protein